MKQSVDCYVQKEAPERPLLIKAKLLPHLSLALLLFIVPPMLIIGALITCVVLRGGNAHAEGRTEKPSENEEVRESMIGSSTDTQCSVSEDEQSARESRTETEHF